MFKIQKKGQLLFLQIEKKIDQAVVFVQNKEIQVVLNPIIRLTVMDLIKKT